MLPISKALFPLGRTVATPSALKELEARGMNPSQLLDRHITGDFGDLCKEDKQTNLDAIKHGDRILSAYKLQTPGHPVGCCRCGELPKLYVITEYDRSVTSIILAEEY